ncbi:MAG: AI-2E family transporter [bacterium]
MRYFFILALLVLSIYLLKDYINFILGIIVFSYFSEVFIDIFTKIKQKIQDKLEQKIQTDSKIINFFKSFSSSFIKLIKIDLAFIYLFYLVIIFLIIFVVIPPVFIDIKNIFSQIFNNLPNILNNLKNFINSNPIVSNFIEKNNINEIINQIDFNGLFKNYLEFIQKIIVYILNFIVSNLSILFFIFVPLFSIYFLTSKESFKNWVFNNFHYIKGIDVFIESYDKYQKLYLKAILVNIISIMFISSLVFNFIFGLKGISLGVLYGLFSFIPVIGPIFGSLPAIILGFSKSFFTGIFVIFLVFIIQQLSDNFIMPKIIRDHLNLNPLITIFSILGFSRILGVWAVFIAPPLVLSIKDLIEFIAKNINNSNKK